MNQSSIEEFIGEKDIVSYLSKKYNIDKRIISSITNYSFIFTKRVIADNNDEKGIMLRYFGKFRLKNRFVGNKYKGAKINKDE